MLGDYGGLVNRDLPVLIEAGFTITVRLEVGISYHYDTGAHSLHSGLGIRPAISR